MTIYVSASGGLDSTALLASLVATQFDVRAVSFDYGQRHRKELIAAAQVAIHLGVPHVIVTLPNLSSPALTEGQPVPHGHYAAETMRQTVVQGRNLLFIATLVGLTQPGDQIAVGVHAGDHAIYPDCRPAFIAPIAAAVYETYGVTVLSPFLRRTKADIVTTGVEYGAPFDLTWSCYEGGEMHCGRCGTCVERIEAFMLADVPDPTVYADPDFAATVL